MKDRNFIFFVFGLLLLTFFLVLHDSHATFIEKEKHCVAYVAKKRLMFIRNVEVIGKNCDVRTQVLPDIGGLFSFKLEIPIEHFASGEEQRDKDVKKILKAEKQASLYFTSEKKTKEDWQKLIHNQREVNIEGTLTIANVAHKVRARVEIIKEQDVLFAKGVIVTRFKDLGLKPPELFGGFMAKVKQDLELKFVLNSEKTLGFDSLK